MNIRPSAAIRQNYNEIADLCRTSQEPVYLTRNGEGDLVVMDMETFSRREKMLDLREQLLSVEEDRMAGNKGYTIDELDKYLDDIISGVWKMEYEKYKVIITEKAKNMLASNIAFIAKVSADAATKQKKAVIDGIRSLEQMPKRYPFFNEEYIPPNKYRKMFIKKWYLILYQIQEDVVYVDYILDYRKDYQWLDK